MNTEDIKTIENTKPTWEKPLIKDYGYVREVTEGGNDGSDEGVGGSFNSG